MKIIKWGAIAVGVYIIYRMMWSKKPQGTTVGTTGGKIEPSDSHNASGKVGKTIAEVGGISVRGSVNV